MKKVYVLLLILCCINLIYGQIFTEIDAGLPGGPGATVVWGDYDNDGDIDLLLASTHIPEIFQNDSSTFSGIDANLLVFDTNSAAWGDYDNDGDLDIVFSGDSQNMKSPIYNNEDGIFTDINASLTSVELGSAAWGDYDNDGDLDIVLTGQVGLTSCISKIYRNDSGIFTDVNAGLTEVYKSSVAWGDYDNDGDLDILLTGHTSTGSLPVSKVYRNDSKIFTEINSGLTGVENGSVAWGDYDNDGDLDILLTGFDGTKGVSRIYRNDSGSFIDINAGLKDVYNGSASWGDYDNDGDLDLVLSGSTGKIRLSKIYRNDSGSFLDVNAGLIGVDDSSVAWGDYDNDSDLDLVLSGNIGVIPYYFTKIYRNNSPLSNSKPTFPINLISTVTDSTITFTWDKATDNETTQAGLSYNFYLGTEHLAENLKTAMSDPATGYRKVVSLGNAQQNNSFTLLNDLPDGKYYWSVQAIDHAFAGSEFAEEQTFLKGSFVDSGINNIPALFSGSAAWGDYDNDGDLDILLMGNTYSFIFLTEIYRNDAGLFTDINAGLTDVQNGSATWGDYDNDGDLDVAISGSDINNQRVTKIYRNDSGAFTDQNAVITGLSNSSIAWGDYDNDGDLDILLTGYTGSLSVSKVYQNDSGIFTEINANLTGVNGGASAWGDYDNDGDLDILLSGSTGSLRVTKIYQNNSGIFTDINAGLTGVADGSSEWGDFDNDGDLDILLTGYTGSLSVSKVYRNDSGVFTDINAGLTGASGGESSWGDYDNDGDLDVLLTGGISKVYRNESGLFYDIYTDLIGMNSSSAAWGDYDDDGDLDILLSSNFYPVSAKVYRNITETTNTVPNSPIQLSSVVKGRNVTFYWNKATDNETTQDGLSYNIYIGTTNQNCQEKSPMSNQISGYRKVVSLGNANQSTSLTVKDLPDGTYYWSIQAIDHAFAGSLFAEVKTFIVSYEESQHFTDINADLLSVKESSAVWGDYDNDGDLDILLTGSDSSKIYRNDSGTFVDINEVLQGVKYCSAAWGDYDNDGDLDILLTGDTISGSTSKVYRNDSGTFTDINAGLAGVSMSSVAWGDYDNDGDLDILLSGTVDGTIATAISIIYRNDDGLFVDLEAGLKGVYFSSVSWSDYDNDGDLDIFLSGYSSSGSYTSRIYKNNNGIFLYVIGLTGVKHSSAAWGDYDNDGDVDILLTGQLSTGGYISKIYRNDSGAFTDINAGIIGVYMGSTAWGDYDNDGDLDILLSGCSSTDIISKIYRNDSGVFIDIDAGLVGVIWGSATWGDYNDDGNLDILLTGGTSGGRISKIYRNDSVVLNSLPNSPSNLAIVNTDSTVTFTWNKATDNETPQNGLTYNLYVRSDSLYAKSPMSNIQNGYRKLVSIGNVNQKNTWTIKDLPNGRYYWSVQAVDHAFAGSEFAVENSLLIADLSIPVNLEIRNISNSVKITWDAVPNATSYKIFACDVPYGIFVDVSTLGTFDSTSWSQTTGDVRKFYYVVAVAE